MIRGRNLGNCKEVVFEVRGSYSMGDMEGVMRCAGARNESDLTAVRYGGRFSDSSECRS